MTGLKPCNQCGLPVRWVKEQGRWQCFNANGTVHWDTCSKERTRRANREGRAFKDQNGEGVRWRGKKRYNHQFNEVVHRTGPKDIPPWPPGVLPWEDA